MTWNLVDLIANNLLALLPLKIIHSFERGVKFHLGTDVAELGPGIHLFIPFFQSIEVIHVVPEVVNLPTQSLTTVDGHHISFSANIEFEVHDARAMFVGVQDFQSSLMNMAMNHLAYRVREWTWQELREGQRELERSMKDTLTTRVKKWGVTVLSVGITDLVEAQTYRIFGETGTTIFKV